MTTRITQTLLAVGLVASLGVTVSARDDDPRDFKKDSRDNSRYNSDRYRGNNQNNSGDRRNDDDRDNEKVTICHKPQRDDDDDDNRNGLAAKTITVSKNALTAHLKHGDTIGPCPASASR
jgi:hypothetical protein